MMSSPTSLAIVGRGIRDATSSHGKSILQQSPSLDATPPTQELKTQRCYGYYVPPIQDWTEKSNITGLPRYNNLVEWGRITLTSFY
jgi:hypothetical protein